MALNVLVEFAIRGILVPRTRVSEITRGDGVDVVNVLRRSVKRQFNVVD